MNDRLDNQKARIVKEWAAVAGFKRGEVSVAELTLEGKIECSDMATEFNLRNNNTKGAIRSIGFNIQERNKKIIRDYCS